MDKTPEKTIKVLFLAAEAAPFIKAGGLGDVTGSLPPALTALPPELIEGYHLDIRLALPFHSAIPRSSASARPAAIFNIRRLDGEVTVRVHTSSLGKVQVYLIDGDPIPTGGPLYSLDTQMDGEKFTFFSVAALEMCRKIGWQPDIVHGHDWHVGIAVHQLARLRREERFFRSARSLFTIHNLPYMGAGTDQALQDYGIFMNDDSRLPWWGHYQPLPMALSAADHLNAVSPTYSREILTPEFGCGLEGFLQSRADTLTGILNGLDIDAWNPLTDRALTVPFGADTLAVRQVNKTSLLEESGLVADPAVPLLVLISRFDRQKGIDLVADALRQIADQPWQAVLLGNGDPILEEAARQLEREMPERVRAALRFDVALSRRMYASGDMLLMPSRYEPCGLAQMIAMRYGCLTVAHGTGGLRDTIFDTDDPARSTGFLFEQADAQSLAAALRRALAAYDDRAGWEARQRYCMQQDFSWQRSALAYFRIYHTLLTDFR